VARTLFAIAVGLGATWVSALAVAAPGVRLDYSAAPGVSDCPPESRLREAVVLRLGEDPFDAASQRSFRVEVAAVAAGLEGRITLEDENGKVAGSRRFEGGADHCAELISAMALAISLAINPDLAEVSELPTKVVADSEPVPAPPIPEQPAQPASPRRAAQQRNDAPAPALPDESAPAWTFAFGAGVNAALGAGPSPALGAVAFGRLRRRDASIALEARFDAPFDRAVGSASVHSSLWAGALAPCVHLTLARGCWVALAGDVAAGSRGVTEARRAHGFFVATGPRLGVEWPLLERLSLSAQSEGLVTVKPVRIVLDGRQVWRTPPLSGSLALAVVWQIP
jgi:hypothetical protein